MRKIREVLRLTAARLSARQIASSVGIARSTVSDLQRRAIAAGVSWPLPEEVDEDALTHRLYPSPPAWDVASVPLPDWPVVHRELSRKGVTLMLLWQEYKVLHPDGYQYSRFADLYRAWAGTRDVVLRQTHTPGDKLFVDYAGQTIGIVDRRTGELRQAQIFVAALGHSSYLYVEATWTQTVPDWLASHVRALEFFGGVPVAIVPDNLKSGVLKAHRYDPDINPSYQDWAEHYATTILPARVRKPRDKAVAESSVLVVERRLLAPLREQTFFSLNEGNAAIRPLLDALNRQPFQKREGSRHSVYETAEKPALKPLPGTRYEYAEWKKAKVHLDYHVEVDRHRYSVPHALTGRTVDVRLCVSSVEVYLRGARVATHPRSDLRGGFTTCPAHRPAGHTAVAELTLSRLLMRAETIGPNTVGVVKSQMHMRKHPEYALRACLGILRLAHDFSPLRLEAACKQALAHNSTSYRAIRALIKHALPQTELTLDLPEHANVRGPSYYH